MAGIAEHLDRLKQTISEQDFLEGKGLANEVNIRIFSYDPEDEMIVRNFVERLTSDDNLPCNLIEYNLYKIFLSICEDKRILDKIPQQEEKKGKDFIYNQLTKMADNEAFVKKMYYEPQKTGDVILITGVGEVYPFMRVHSLLEAMQPYFGAVPIVVMYPGEYDGRNVKLFKLLQPNPYYRAFKTI